MGAFARLGCWLLHTGYQILLLALAQGIAAPRGACGAPAARPRSKRLMHVQAQPAAHRQRLRPARRAPPPAQRAARRGSSPVRAPGLAQAVDGERVRLQARPVPEPGQQRGHRRRLRLQCFAAPPPPRAPGHVPRERLPGPEPSRAAASVPERQRLLCSADGDKQCGPASAAVSCASASAVNQRSTSSQLK